MRAEESTIYRCVWKVSKKRAIIPNRDKINLQNCLREFALKLLKVKHQTGWLGETDDQINRWILMIYELQWVAYDIGVELFVLDAEIVAVDVWVGVVTVLGVVLVTGVCGVLGTVGTCKTNLS